VNFPATVPTPIEACSVADLARLEPFWRDLGSRALEPNPFAESAFLIPATRRIAPRGLVALCVWGPRTGTRLDAVAILRAPLLPFAIVDVWRSEQAPLAALLVDRERAVSSLEAMADWVRQRWPTAVALGLPNVAVAGPLACAIRALATGRSSRLYLVNSRPRAALPCGPNANFVRSLDPRRRKEWGRQRRRLEQLGKLEFDWSDQAAAVEDFLNLEAASWKGPERTALIAEPNRATFARETLALFASQQRLRIALLSLGGRPIAAGAVLRSGSRAFYWKTAFDPAFARLSPGVQLTLAMSRDLEADHNLTLSDSCADANHPMIDRIWTSRIDLADFVLEANRDTAFALPLAIGARRAKTIARERTKRLVRTWRRRRQRSSSLAAS
jgi:CelD/BcsL family acetyltransferase involved in cellulose biosynthesis